MASGPPAVASGPVSAKFTRLAKTSVAGVTDLFETESYFLVQILAKGYQFDTHTAEIKLAEFGFNYVIINNN